jgi:hypothetical protein
VHRDVHPLQFGFDELWETVLQFGTVMRSLYPNIHLNGHSHTHALHLLMSCCDSRCPLALSPVSQHSLARFSGPSWSNWCWYWWVRGDGCGGLDGTDFKSHGSVFTNPWLLRKVNDYFLATGVKLLDSLDVHVRETHGMTAATQRVAP